MTKYTDLQLKNESFKGLKLYEPDCYHDFRGYYWTVIKGEHTQEFNHDKISVSKQNVLRGIHGDTVATKLITCVYGEVYYVAVDNRKDSLTYKEWNWTMLSHTNRKVLIVPPGIGSSYLIMSHKASMLYKWSYKNNYPDVDNQFTIPWDDPTLNISWPINNPILQTRNKNKI